MLSLPLILAAAVAQVLSDPQPLAQAPSSWRKPNINTSLKDRVSLAQAAISQAIGQLDTTNSMFPDPSNTYSISGAFYSQLAEFDQLTNQSQYAANLGGYYGSAKTLLQQQFGAANFTGFYINDGLNFGHGAIIAYKTYNVSTFLQYAIQTWWAAVPYTLTQTALDAGKIPSKSFNLTASCQGITMAGGTFWSKDQQNPDIVGLATGSFLVLSALLAEATADPLYLSAALQSMTFIHSHLYNVQNVVQDLISARANDSCALGSAGLQPYNSGFMIEGLAVLYTLSKNATYSKMIDDIVSASLATTGWQDATGIIQTGVNKTGDGTLPRGLVAAYRRNATSPSLRPYIASYLAVQYNAAVDLAKKSGGDIYGQSWLGPAGTTFNAGAQVNAIQALISSIALDDPILPPTPLSLSSSGFSFSSNAPGSSPTLPSSPGPTHKTKTSIGGVVGGVVGGLVALALLAGLAFCWGRKRGHSRLKTPSPQSPNSALDMRDRHFDFLAGYTGQLPDEQPQSTNVTVASSPHQQFGGSPHISPYQVHDPVLPVQVGGSLNPVRRAPSPSPSSESWALPPPTLIGAETHSSSDSPSVLSADTGRSLSPLSPKRRQASDPAIQAVTEQPTTEELVRMLYDRMNSRPGTNVGGYEEALPEYRTAVVP
ncbi:Glycoside hydrolase family 76 protein [Mycena indigotica]|uniref:Glycoside hydrolase family 76 protein n=1 Tax=Mycena indigotica TaxID=2126181 RepID=A0A8H6SD52_9AGAR|nr:Glycoside hydrolase family 76 protein [Mycena indigotica]KAF7296752.1 Glycoside hydrolase family 76 protein [Mycena indigotica]